MRLRGRAGIAVALVLLLAGCAASPAPPPAAPSGVPGEPVREAGCVEVVISGHAWPASRLPIPRGTCVEFTNLDFMNHRFTDPSGSVDSGDLFRKERWNHTFKEAGTFPLEILKHPGRVMVVEVG